VQVITHHREPNRIDPEHPRQELQPILNPLLPMIETLPAVDTLKGFQAE
jgi:hypothetical protein